MLTRCYALISRNLRYRVLALVLFPILLVMPVVVGMAYLWSNEVGHQQLLMKVSTDLSVAHNAFDRMQQAQLQKLSLIAESYPFQQAAQALFNERDDSGPIRLQMTRLQQRAEFDFVHLRDPQGCDLIGSLGCSNKRTALLDRSRIDNGSTGVTLLAAAELERIDLALAERIVLPVPQPSLATPRPRQIEDRGMVLLSDYPIRDSEGEVRAFLSVGVLVNGNVEFIQSLKQRMYGAGSLATLSVFLGDVRISSNPLSQQDVSAIGTRASQEVLEQVVGHGRQWIDRTWEVSQWYISGYEPIIDVYGQRVGMLYAGFLEPPFKESYFQALRWLAILFGLLALLGGLLAVAGARSIFKPIEAMARVIRQVRTGEDVRIGALDSTDELGMLAVQFDAMLDQLSRQHQQLQAGTDQLEIKVAERTDQLQQRTFDLQQNLDLLKRTRQQLVAKEKLAAIGELAAGIAHEINNPTAVILGNMDLLVLELGDAAAPVARESELIIEQVYRIRTIINNLLQYSRPSDYRPLLTPLDINQVINDTLVLVRHDLAKKSIRLKLDLRARRSLHGNPQHYQQVLINLIVNAVNALADQPQTGHLTIRSRDRDDGVLVLVKDNGCGIDRQVLPRIFDPFFSRTQGGTGLGLSVSYGILQRYYGQIEVRSRPGVGSSFFVLLQADPRVNHAAEAEVLSFF